MIELDPRTTALVLIDLQNGIVGRTLAPRSGAEVVDRAKEIAQRFRAAGARVVLSARWMVGRLRGRFFPSLWMSQCRARLAGCLPDGAS